MKTIDDKKTIPPYLGIGDDTHLPDKELTEEEIAKMLVELFKKEKKAKK